MGDGLIKWLEDLLPNRDIRMILKDRVSNWWPVMMSGVPQGSVLAPIMFAVYINDMVDRVFSCVSLSADDAKLLRPVNIVRDCEALRRDLDRTREWSGARQTEFNLGNAKNGVW